MEKTDVPVIVHFLIIFIKISFCGYPRLRYPVYESTAAYV